MDKKETSEVFAPGEFLLDELEARGWSQKEFAEIIGRPHALVNQIVLGKKAITPETARELAAALGTSAELWLNLQSAFDLAKLGSDDATIIRRSALHSAAPINEMRRRGWIKGSRDVGALESELLTFFGVKSIESISASVRAAARKATGFANLSPAQAAWCRRAKELAEGAEVERPFTETRMRALLDPLRAAARTPEGSAEVGEILKEAGVRLVVVKHLEGTRIDGAAMWLGAGRPVVALSLRFDRIDSFWFTLGHEIGHLLNGDAKDFIDDDLNRDVADLAPDDAEERPAAERSADEFAARWLLPKAAMDRYLTEARGRFDRRSITEFARSVAVHPGIVAGRLQWMGKIRYAAHRDMLAKVRVHVLARVASDGWD